LKWNDVTAVWGCEADNSGGAPTWDTIAVPGAAQTLAMDADTTTFNWSQSTDSALDAWTMSYDHTNAASTTNQTLMTLKRIDSGGAHADIDALLHVENEDTNDAVTTGILIDAAAGLITTGIDVSDAQVTTAIDVGGGFIAGTTTLNFDPDGDGVAECSMDTNGAIDCSAHPTSGGALTLKEDAAEAGSNTFQLKVPDSGLTGNKVCTLQADGDIKADCIAQDEAYSFTGLITTDDLVVDGVLDLGTVETFTDSDATPDVSTGSWWNTNTTGVTITDFDGAGILAGQVITVTSKGAIVYDCTANAELCCGIADITTASGDVTTWQYDGTCWQLLSIKDESSNMGAPPGAETNDLETIATNAATNEVFVGSGPNAGTYITMPVCDLSEKIQYTDAAPNTFTCVADNTDPLAGEIDAGDFGAAVIDGDDINSNLAGDGLILTADAPDTLDIDLNATKDGDGLGLSLSGMEFTATNELALLQGCLDEEILKWVDSNGTWDCAPDGGELTNVIYVTIADDINAAIASASAGDTLILDAGTYDIGATTLTVDKQLNIIGQGNAGLYSVTATDVHGTRIFCDDNNVSLFTITSSNVRIAHMSLITQGGGTSAKGIETSNNLDGLVFTNIDVVMESGAGVKTAFDILGSNAILRDVTFNVISTNNTAYGVYAHNDSSTTQNVRSR
jgi:hypothetical protein